MRTGSTAGAVTVRRWRIALWGGLTWAIQGWVATGLGVHHERGPLSAGELWTLAGLKESVEKFISECISGDLGANRLTISDTDRGQTA